MQKVSNYIVFSSECTILLLATRYYVAPEVLVTSVYDGRRADAWSMGVLLYYFATATFPFESLELYDNVRDSSSF